MKRAGFLMVAALALVATTASASTANRWLHVRVEESGAGGDRVRVNLPLALLEKVAEAIDLEALDGGTFRGGKIVIHEAGMEGIDLRKLWEAIRTTEDMEFVSVESDDHTVRVAKDGKYLIASVREGDEPSDKRERVEARIPLAVVDALLSGEENELNLIAALRALAEYDDGDLLLVNDESTSVRIWIDDRNTSE